MQINAMIAADSLSPQGDRLTSLLITFPRIILSEVNTHRMLSKNTSSSRAIPFKKMVESVQNDPFIPIAWQKDHKGMQGTEYFTDESQIKSKINCWLNARDHTLRSAKYLNSDLVVHKIGDETFISFNQTDEDSIEQLMAKKRLENTKVTKQLCNRLLEPFMWTTMLITGSKEGWDNFFHLRCPQYLLYSEQMPIYFKSKKDLLKYVHKIETDEFKEQYDNLTNLDWLLINEGQAEIHIMDLAEKIYDAMKESNPKQLKAGEWHIPYEDKISSDVEKWSEDIDIQTTLWGKDLALLKVKVSTAMAARTSYTVVEDEKEIDYERMIDLHDRLLAQDPPHSSPMEHCARAMSDEEYYEFAKGRLLVKDGYGDGDSLDQDIDNGTEGWCRNFKGFIQYRHLIEMRNGDKN